MCRWVAYSGRPIFLETLVSQPRHSLIHQSHSAHECKVATNGDGFGVGWYGAFSEPGLYRDILPAWSDENLRSLCRQIASPLFFAHVRASTGTATSRANCHPFAVDEWLFMHNGQVGGWEILRRPVESLLSDRNYGARKGTTDSEAIFLLNDPVHLRVDPVRSMAETLGKIRFLALQAGVDEPLRFAAALTDGKTLYAFRYASDAHPPTLYWQTREEGVTVVSEPLDAAHEGWRAVEANSVLVVAQGGEVTLRSFDVAPCDVPQGRRAVA